MLTWLIQRADWCESQVTLQGSYCEFVNSGGCSVDGAGWSEVRRNGNNGTKSYSLLLTSSHKSLVKSRRTSQLTTGAVTAPRMLALAPTSLIGRLEFDGQKVCSVSFGVCLFVFVFKGPHLLLKVFNGLKWTWNISHRYVKHPIWLSGHWTVCHCQPCCGLKCELRDFCLLWGSFVFPVYSSKNCEQILMELSSGCSMRNTFW